MPTSSALGKQLSQSDLAHHPIRARLLTATRLRIRIILTALRSSSNLVHIAQSGDAPSTCDFPDTNFCLLTTRLLPSQPLNTTNSPTCLTVSYLMDSNELHYASAIGCLTCMLCLLLASSCSPCPDCATRASCCGTLSRDHHCMIAGSVPYHANAQHRLVACHASDACYSMLQPHRWALSMVASVFHIATAHRCCANAIRALDGRIDPCTLTLLSFR